MAGIQQSGIQSFIDYLCVNIYACRHSFVYESSTCPSICSKSVGNRCWGNLVRYTAWAQRRNVYYLPYLS